MEPLRLVPLAFAALRLLIGRLPLFLRLSWLCMAVSLVGVAVIPRHPLAGGIVDLLARGVFVVAWLRLVGLGEVPAGRHYFRLGRREALGGFVWMMTELFVGAPAQLIAAALAIAVGLPLGDTALVLTALTHLLLGGTYLIPADAALGRTRRGGAGKGWRAPDLILRGGLALGVAAFVCRLPMELLLEGTRLLPDRDVGEGFGLRDMAEIPVRYLGMALMAGTMALAWNRLSREEDAAG